MYMHDSICYIINIDSLFIIDQVPVTGKRNKKLQITNRHCVRFGMIWHDAFELKTNLKEALVVLNIITALLKI